MGARCSKFSEVSEANSEDDVLTLPWEDGRTKERDETTISLSRRSSPQRIVPSLGNTEDEQELGGLLPEKAQNCKAKTSTAGRTSAQKVSEVGSLIGRAGTAGLGKAVKALDTFGSTFTNLGGGFTSGVAQKGSKIGILAFELANTIVKGSNLKQSLSDGDMRILMQETLVSEGVKRLVSQNMQELLRIAAADKKDELKIFTREVVRFGNHCQDPQWHRLDRIFSVLGTDVEVPFQTDEEADAEMRNLMTLAEYTSELYHELYSLDRMELELRRKEDLFSGPHRGESIAVLKNDLKAQQKHVKHLKKQSLWSKMTEEVMGQLVDIVYYLHQLMINSFGSAVFLPPKSEEVATTEEKVFRKDVHRSRGLGASGLALHYANIINQIDNLVSRPNSVPPSTRDSLYQGLPPRIKASFRVRLEQASYKEELTAGEIRKDMEKILDWLVPIASNTTKVHHGFGWVGEWAKSGSTTDRQMAGYTELTLLQTLHHADQECVEEYLLELIVDLHYLINSSRNALNGPRPPRNTASPTEKKSIPPSPPSDALPPFSAHMLVPFLNGSHQL